MSNTTYKLVKLVGESEAGLEDAVRTALATSAENVRHQSWCQVTDIRANVGEGGSVERWQVEVEVAFRVES
jgi:flavin-binding protein dodecin